MRLICVMLLAVTLFASGCQTLHSQQRASAADTAAIERVIDTFKTSIANKDKAAYMALFFSNKPEEIGWQYVSEDTRLEKIRNTKPDAIKARKIPTNNFVSLIDAAVAATERHEEVFSNVAIDSDGEIASVSFDYVFLMGNQKTNWGREMWQLVRTEGGWKIFSVVYTIRDELSALR